MKIYYLFLLLPLLTSFSFFGNQDCPTGTVFNSFSNEIKKTEGFTVAGTGCAMPTGKLRKIFMAFECCRVVNLEEARKLYIQTVDGLQENVNQNVLIRPYMEEFPFTWKNIDVTISFVDKKGNHLKNGNLVHVVRVDKRLCFATLDEKTGYYKTIHREPFEDSLKIVKGEIPDPYTEPSKE